MTLSAVLIFTFKRVIAKFRFEIFALYKTLDYLQELANIFAAFDCQLVILLKTVRSGNNPR
jgi:hypothetical protein